MTVKKSISNVQRTGILITLLTAQFITAMSTSVTGNMIPNFMEYFGVTSDLAQWVTSGATLISGIAISITAFQTSCISLLQWQHEPVVSESDHFTGEAEQYARFLTEKIITSAEETLTKSCFCVIAGYSMG